MESKNFPEGHRVQALSPVVSPYRPVRQREQEGDADGEYRPMGHKTQVVELVAPTELDALPATHDLHAEAPVVSPNRPAGQDVQLVDRTDDANRPIGQDVQVDAAEDEKVPAGQASHAADVVAPATEENSPAEHARHTLSEVAPVEDEYRPASHSVQEGEPVLEA